MNGFYKEFGIVKWNFATIYDTFDESFLRVPIVKSVLLFSKRRLIPGSKNHDNGSSTGKANTGGTVSCKEKTLTVECFASEVDGTTYALVVIDPSAINQFLQNYPPSKTPNPNGGNFVNFPPDLFNELTDIALDYGDTTALAFILNKYNAGISLTKMDSEGNFRAVNITSTNNPDGSVNYTYNLCPN